MSVSGPLRLRPKRWLGRGVVALAMILAVASHAAALEVGVESRPAVMTSAAAPNRQALIIAPSGGGGGVAADVEAYVATLRLIGFDVTTIVADSRPELDGALRRVASGVRPDAEVVVVALGTILARGADLYVTPAPPTPDLLRRPELYGTEGIALADALRRIQQRGPKDVVAFVDACRAADGAADCQRGTTGLPDGVSAIVAYRTHAAGAAPVAGIGSVRSNAVALMHREGLSFFAFYEALQKDLRGTDMALATTSSLSRSFVFLPKDFLARLPTPCNEVSVWTSEDALRAHPLDRIVAACEEAARTYDFSPHFKDKLEVVREQSAFHDAVAGCSDLGPADAYLRTHPTGPHRPVVEKHKETCRPPPPPPPPVVEAKPPPRPRLVPRGNQPASFACQGYMSEPVAQLICNDRDLAAADWRLGIAYRAAMMSRNPTSRRALMSEERAWLERRNAVCGIPSSGQWDPSELARFKDCLLREIDRRAHEIELNL